MVNFFARATGPSEGNERYQGKRLFQSGDEEGDGSVSARARAHFHAL